MSITFTDGRQFVADAGAAPWNNQPAAGHAFRFRYEASGATSAAVLNTNYIIEGGAYYVYTQAASLPGTMQLVFNVRNAAGSTAQKSVVLNVGTTYHFAMTYTSGEQILWVNGIPTTFGTKAGNTQTATQPAFFGVPGMHGTLGLVYTIDDFGTWDGYVPSAADVAGLRDGTLTAADIGSSATRHRWTLRGTPGATVALGDPGLANVFGDHAWDLKHVAGTGSAVYSPDLVFEPAATTMPRVASSGRSVVFSFASVVGGAATMPLQAIVAPTVSVNGMDKGPLVNALCDGRHTDLYHGLPDGVLVVPGDVVTLSAPAAWVNTGVGIVGAMDHQAVENCAGRSAYGIDGLIKTLRPGTNNAHGGSKPSGVYTITKNWIKRSFIWNGATSFDGYKPIAGNIAEVSATIWDVGPQTNLDQTFVFPSGRWAIGWRDTAPTPHPTICRLFAGSPLTLSVVEGEDMANPGSGGVGIVRVFDCTQIATVSQGPFNGDCNLMVGISNTTKSFNFDDLVVYGPGDFDSSPGVPTVLDVGDPTAISNTYKSRLGPNPGSLRWCDSFFGDGGGSQESEPEHVHLSSDFSWGVERALLNIPFTSLRPWNPAVTPYIYTTLFGSPYDVVLAGPIPDATTTTLTITPDPANPVMVGLRLGAGGELMRIMAVSGPTVTVERGSCGTTAAAHAAGTIRCQNRLAAAGAITTGQVWEMVSSVPHQFCTGMSPGRHGSWPTSLAFTDGSHTSGPQIVAVTGPSTLMGIVNSPQKPAVTIAAPVALDPSCSFYRNGPDGAAIPIEFGAKVAASFDGCMLHNSLPHLASDSLAWQSWRWVVENYPDGRPVPYEYSDESWNGAFIQFTPLNRFSGWNYPNAKGWEWPVRRTCEMVAIGREVYSRAGRDPSLVRGMFNVRPDDVGTAAAALEFAHGLGVPLSYIAIADYLGIDRADAMRAAIWRADDGQAVDLNIHDLRTRVGGFRDVFAAHNAVLASYNAAHGEHAQLYCYEGGVAAAAPVFATTLALGVDAVATAIGLASVGGLVAGTPLLCGSEWLTFLSAAGNIATVTRGAYGSTAAAHAPGVGLRSAWVERSHDLIYNPNWYYLEFEQLAMEQAADIAAVNRYSAWIGSAEFGETYGIYRYQTQEAGKGDGSDGKADNRLTLCTPGKSHSKAADVPQDLHCVSVRGRAMLDWMGATAPSGKKSKLIYGPCRRRR